MENGIEITPEDSITPIYLVEETQESVKNRQKDLEFIQGLEKKQEEKEAALANALAKLKKLGLTEDEAKAIAGV